MGDTHGFLKVQRKVSSYRPVCERVKDYREVAELRSDEMSEEQGNAPRRSDRASTADLPKRRNST